MEPCQPSATDLIQIQPVPGKGRGIIASATIPKGTRIIMEQPIIRCPFIPGPVGELILSDEVAALADTGHHIDHNLILSLSHSTAIVPDSGHDHGRYATIFRIYSLPAGAETNPPCLPLFMCDLPEADTAIVNMRALFPTIRLINHDCMPNAAYTWNTRFCVGVVHATRFIPAGEEITIAYTRTLAGTTERQQHLLHDFGFECTCTLCMAPPHVLEQSNLRRLRISALCAVLGQRWVADENLALCNQLIGLLKDEFGDDAPMMTIAYWEAFKVCAGVGDRRRAMVFAGRALRTRLVRQGGDNEEAELEAQCEITPETFSGFELGWQWERTSPWAEDEHFEMWLFRTPKVDDI